MSRPAYLLNRTVQLGEGSEILQGSNTIVDSSGNVAADTSKSGDATLASTDSNVILDALSGTVAFKTAGQTITDNSDVDVSVGFAAFNTTGGATANTLPDGTEGGQLLILAHVGGGNNAVVTPDTFFNGSTITLTLGDSIFLIWIVGGGWLVLGNQGAAIA